MGGPHPIRWRPYKESVKFPKEEAILPPECSKETSAESAVSSLPYGFQTCQLHNRVSQFLKIHLSPYISISYCLLLWRTLISHGSYTYRTRRPTQEKETETNTYIQLGGCQSSPSAINNDRYTFKKCFSEIGQQRARSVISEKESKWREPYNYPGFLPRGTIWTKVQGRETQAGDGCLTELKRQRSELGAQSTACIWHQQHIIS